MKYNTTPQRGSAHVVIVICLVLALLTSLGWIFYQNFIAKSQATTKTDLIVVKQKGRETVISTNSTYRNQLGGFSFDYPKSRQLKAITSQTSDTIATIDGNVTVASEVADSSKPVNNFSASGAILMWKVLHYGSGGAQGYGLTKADLLSESSKVVNGVNLSLYEMNAQTPYLAVVFVANSHVNAISFPTTLDKLSKDDQLIMNTIKLLQ